MKLEKPQGVENKIYQRLNSFLSNKMQRFEIIYFRMVKEFRSWIYTRVREEPAHRYLVHAMAKCLTGHSWFFINIDHEISFHAWLRFRNEGGQKKQTWIIYESTVLVWTKLGENKVQFKDLENYYIYAPYAIGVLRVVLMAVKVGKRNEPSLQSLLLIPLQNCWDGTFPCTVIS